MTGGPSGDRPDDDDERGARCRASRSWAAAGSTRTSRRSRRRRSCPTATSSARTATPARRARPAGRIGRAARTAAGPGRSKARLLPRTEDPLTTNFLKLSLSPDGRTIYAYGARSYDAPGRPLRRRARDGGGGLLLHGRRPHAGRHRAIVPQPPGGLEISHGILPLRSGRLLAPAATVPPESVRRAGRRGDLGRWRPLVAARRRRDAGPGRPPRLSRAEDGRAGAGSCHRVGLDRDAGRRRGPAEQLSRSPTTAACHGPRRGPSARWARRSRVVPLDDDRVMLLYNRRYGEQGIVMALARHHGRELADRVGGPDVRREGPTRRAPARHGVTR